MNTNTAQLYDEALPNQGLFIFEKISLLNFSAYWLNMIIHENVFPYYLLEADINSYSLLCN